ncbi:hypothetical protein D9M68_154050 [compost metagenome]
MRERDLEAEYDRLVGLCYECVLDENAWLPLLKGLAGATGRQFGALLFWDLNSATAQASEINLCESSAIDAYNREFCNLDPSRGFMLNRAVGDWYHDLQHYGRQNILTDPYYQEFHFPHGMRNISCMKLHEQPSSGIFLSLLTSTDAAEPGAEQQALLQRLGPHLLQAARMFERISDMRVELAKRDLLLDQHPTPLWLLDSDSRVLYCNQAAQQRMRQRGAPFYENFQRLHSRQQGARLQALVRQACERKDRSKRQAGWLRLDGDPPCELLVTPIPADAAFNLQFQKPLALLALLEQARPGPLLAELFGLSPAERRLCELLSLNLTPEQCAERLGVSINTVRSQLRSLFRKTGTERQVELVGLIGRLRQ